MPQNERYQPSDCRGRRCDPDDQGFNGGSVYHDMRVQRQQDCYRQQPQDCYPQRYNNYGRTQRDCGGRSYSGNPPETLGARDYGQKLEQVFGKQHCVTDKDNYRENLWGAAENKKPVVMVFGRSGDPGNKAVLDAVARAKAQSNGAAEFVYVDLNSVDARSAIGEYSRYIGRDYGTPLTMVFTQKQGEGRTPVIPERPLHYQRGSHLNERTLLDGIARAAEIQKQRDINTGREKPIEPPKPPVAPEADKPVDVKPPEKKPATAQDVINESIKPWKEQKIDELFKGCSPEQRATLAWEAISQADKQNNLRLSAQVRAMVGLASISWGGEAAAAGRKDEAEQHFLRGSEYIMSAGVYNKDIYKYPGFQQVLRESKLPGNAANFLIEHGSKDADRPTGQKPWFYPTEQQNQTNPNAFQDARDRYIAQIKAEMGKAKVLPMVQPQVQPRQIRR